MSASVCLRLIRPFGLCHCFHSRQNVSSKRESVRSGVFIFEGIMGRVKNRCLTLYLRGRVYCSPFPRVCFMSAVLMLMAHSTGGLIKWWRWMLFVFFLSWLFSYWRRLQGQLKPKVYIHQMYACFLITNHEPFSFFGNVINIKTNQELMLYKLLAM